MLMWRLAKAVLKRVVPRHFHPQPYVLRRIRNDSHMVVQSGPFRAMRYVETSVGSVFLPKILGVYEKELHALIERCCVLGFEEIINLGAGEGYYAVGMALRNRAAEVVAFETDEQGRNAIEQLAVRNGVRDRIAIHGTCTPTNLTAALASGKKTLVLCDVEGAELALLDPKAVAGLLRCHVLVELHDFVTRGLSDIIRERFAPSHTIETIWQTERRRRDFPFDGLYATLVPESYLRSVMHEWRPERMAWFWMEPRE